MLGINQMMTMTPDELADMYWKSNSQPEMDSILHVLYSTIGLEETDLLMRSYLGSDQEGD